MAIEFFQITAAYSNALLVAVMPHVTDVAKKLDLPTAQPVTIAQVRQFNCFPRSDHIGGKLVLTNGCTFVFDHGRVEHFESPHSYFVLQEPNLIPKFYGQVKLSKEQALQVAHEAIKKLGYTDAMLSADRPPEITPPPKDGTHYVARYRIRWRDVTRGSDPSQPPPSIEFEIDATTGQIWMLHISNPSTFAADPQLNVPLSVTNQFGTATGAPVGVGRAVIPVSNEYARAFLAAVLPQISEFVRKANLTVKTPVSPDDVDMNQYLAKYSCGIVEGEPRAFIDMKNGDRFVYSHGQVVAFYSADAMNSPRSKASFTYPEIDRERAKLFGSINMTTNAVVALVRQTLSNLGYSEKGIHIDVPPRVNGPSWWGTNRIARCAVEWRQSIDGPTYANAEVDMAKKTLKALYINDHANTNIWRKPPKIDVAP
jgi:hypothetical protein